MRKFVVYNAMEGFYEEREYFTCPKEASRYWDEIYDRLYKELSVQIDKKDLSNEEKEILLHKLVSSLNNDLIFQQFEESKVN